MYFTHAKIHAILTSTVLPVLLCDYRTFCCNIHLLAYAYQRRLGHLCVPGGTQSSTLMVLIQIKLASTSNARGLPSYLGLLVVGISQGISRFDAV